MEDEDDTSLTSLPSLSMSDDEGEGEGTGMGEQILACWNNRKVKLDHDYAVAGWALCVMAEVRQDVDARMDGSHREAIERVVERLHLPPCPNKRVNIDEMSPADIVDKFWDEYKDFKNKTGSYSKAGKWTTDDVRKGRSHLWHEKYSLGHTDVLGFVACRVTSKNLGIGAAERMWAGTKDIKDGKRANLGGASTEKRSILYTSARMSEARVLQKEMEKIDAGPNGMFGEDDIK